MRIRDKQEYDRHILEAAELFNRKEYNQALERFQKLAKVNSDNLKLHELLVYLHLEMGNVSEAKKELAIFQELLKQRGGIDGEYIPPTLEEVASQAGSKEELQQQCSEILQTGGGRDIDADVTTILNLSILYISKGDFDAAGKLVSQYKELFLERTGLSEPQKAGDLSH